MRSGKWSAVVAVALGLGGGACGAAVVEEWRTPTTAASTSGESDTQVTGGEHVVPVQMQGDGGLPIGPAPILFDAGANDPIPLGPDAGAPFSLGPDGGRVL